MPVCTYTNRTVDWLYDLWTSTAEDDIPLPPLPPLPVLTDPPENNVVEGESKLNVEQPVPATTTRTLQMSASIRHLSLSQLQLNMNAVPESPLSLSALDEGDAGSDWECSVSVRRADSDTADESWADHHPVRNGHSRCDQLLPTLELFL